jgi:hypothetical protein
MEGAVSTGVAAGGEEVSESQSSAEKAFGMASACTNELPTGENDRNFSGGGISIVRTTGVGASCMLSSLPENMEHEKTFSG